MIREHMRGQSTIEFTFAMIVIIFLIYGMVRVFRWAGMDLANRRVAQDITITAAYTGKQGPAVQLDPDFYRSQSMDSVYHGNVASGN